MSHVMLYNVVFASSFFRQIRNRCFSVHQRLSAFDISYASKCGWFCKHVLWMCVHKNGIAVEFFVV